VGGICDMREAGGCTHAVKAKIADLQDQVSMRCRAPRNY
jgi:hypothetical protein